MKTLILFEMALLEGGMLLNRNVVQGQTWEQILISEAPGKSGSGVRGSIAVLVLAVLLLTGDEIGLGGAAALFGGLVTLAYLMGAAGWLGDALNSFEGKVFGIDTTTHAGGTRAGQK